ncbi:MAG: REP-associated tyrosine transposase, partial [Gammaproteobacteria bacterium]
ATAAWKAALPICRLPVGRQSFADTQQPGVHPGGARPNYRRYHLLGHPVFITMVTRDRRPWLREPGHVDVLMESMRRVKVLYPFRHAAHGVMPDHVHWMFEAKDGDFSRIVGAVKRDVTWRLKQAGGNGLPPYWQSRFYDHVIRDESDFEQHLHYIHFNPVKHGVVAKVTEHEYSSFRQWVERGVYEADWGSSEPESIKAMELE